MKYFLDNDISHRFALMLRALDVEVVALRDVMPASTPDKEFLGELKRKYGVDVFISNNTAQRTNQFEARLLRSSGVTSLYFGPFWSRLQFWDQAKWLVKHWEQIDGFCRGATQGTCADLKQNGRASIYNF
ncbi:MAG: hypothetical protein SFV23_19190 [Planctomycetaceae bacterium]|nr:hypothetical protein [Planctomycetaceae bacterium]